jgi:ketosteroid isomerase-like protein
MDPRLQQMLDHHEIRALLAEYCQACDRLDPVRMAAVYLPDSWDDHGDAKMPGPAFAEHATQALGRHTEMCAHHLGQSLIQVDGDEAGAETYFIATLRRTGKDGRQVLDQMGGRYVDRLERHGRDWKIKHRICVREWSISHTVERDWLLGVDYVEGKRSGEDPAYGALGRERSGPPVRNEAG